MFENVAADLIEVGLWVLSAIGVGLIATAGSFVLSKYLLIKTLEGPFNSLTFIRRILGVEMLDGMALYTGSFTSRLLMCHNCLAPYAAALVTLAVCLLLRVPWQIGVTGWVAAIGGNIALFDALDVDYE